MENKMTESRQRMTSLEIAEVTGKHHKDVMKAIRTWNQPERKYVGAILRWHPEWFNNPTAELAKFPVTLLQRPYEQGFTVTSFWED